MRTGEFDKADIPANRHGAAIFRASIIAKPAIYKCHCHFYALKPPVRLLRSGIAPPTIIKPIRYAQPQNWYLYVAPRFFRGRIVADNPLIARNFIKQSEEMTRALDNFLFKKGGCLISQANLKIYLKQVFKIGSSEYET